MSFPGFQPSSEFNVALFRLSEPRRQRRRKMFGRMHRLLRSEAGHSLPAMRPHHRLPPVLGQGQEMLHLQGIRRR